jgi:DNA mismatch endonuclease (patch repair protein)
MVDNLTKEQRSFCMSRINSKETIPELILKKEMKHHGFIYQPKNTFGNPDFIHKDKKIVLFIDGCFWHMCPNCFKYPKSNRKYWLPKLRRNDVRAKEVELAYKNEGWDVIRIWEHELKR